MAAKPAGRLDALDGLRGIAILVVLVFHLFTWPVGGFLGVDLFFVLSGFLITNRLLRDAGDFGGRHLRDFYYGRLLRIGPALVEMCLLYGAIKLVSPAKVTLFRENLLSAVFLAANWTRAYQLPYPDYLGHMWSLSIEEQYYLVWPLIVFFALAVLKSERALGRIAGIMVVGLWGVRYALALNPAMTADRLYNGTDTRISSILVGCLAAVLLRDPSFRARLERLGSVGLGSFVLSAAVVAWCIGHFDWHDRPLFFWGLTLCSSACGVMVVCLVAFPDSTIGRALSCAPLVWVGKRSYGLYLFHFPIFLWLLLVQKVQTGWTMAVLALPPTVVLAALSWQYIEEPFMRLRYRKSVTLNAHGTPGPATPVGEPGSGVRN